LARRGSRGLETRKHANRAFKRVTRQWQWITNIKCQVLAMNPAEACPNGGVILLVTNGQLRGEFNDALRIRRIEGTLYFKPDMINVDDGGTSCNESVALSLLNGDVIFRAGLKKSEAPAGQSAIPSALNPLNNGATPTDPSDYADGRWLKLWDHLFEQVVQSSSGQQNQQFTCCSVQDGYVVPPWTLASGSGVWNGVTVPPVVCEPCGDPENPSVAFNCNLTEVLPRWWSMRVRFGRTIVLKEDQSLNLYVGWERMEDINGSGRPVQPDMLFCGSLRMLVES